MFFITDPESESENKRNLRGAFSDTEDYLDHGLVSSARCASRTSSIGSWSECLKPSFTQKLTFRSVLEGEPAVFRCKLVACPIPNVSWFHNNKPIYKDSRRLIKTDSDMHIHNCSLLIKSVEDRDSGSYRIFAINSEGSAECTASLLVALREEQNPKYLDFVRYSEKTHESIDSLVQKRRESRLKVDLKCVGSPFDKRRETKMLHGRYPKKGLVKTISFEKLNSLDSCERRHAKRQDLGDKVLDKEIQRKLNLLREIRKSRRGSRTLSQTSSDAYSDVDLESFLSDASSTTFPLEKARSTLTETSNIGMLRSPEIADIKEIHSSCFHEETLGDHFLNSSIPQKKPNEIKILISDNTDVAGRGGFPDYMKMPKNEKKDGLLNIQRKSEFNADWIGGRVLSLTDEEYEKHQERTLDLSPDIKEPLRSNIQLKLTETSLDSLSVCEGNKQQITVTGSEAPVNFHFEIHTQEMEDQKTNECIRLDTEYESKVRTNTSKAEQLEGEISVKEFSPLNKFFNLNTQQKNYHLEGISPYIKEENFSVADREVYRVPHEVWMKQDDKTEDETHFHILKEPKVAEIDTFNNRPLKNIKTHTEKEDAKMHIQRKDPIRSCFTTDTPDVSVYLSKHHEKVDEINKHEKASSSEKEVTKKIYSKFQIQKEEIKFKEVAVESAKLISFDEPSDSRNFQKLCGSDIMVTSEPRMKEEESISEFDKAMFFDEGKQKEIIEKRNNAMQFYIQDQIQLEEKDSPFGASFNTLYDSLEKEVEIESAKVISFDEPTDTIKFQELCGSDLIVTSKPRIKEVESKSEVGKVIFFDEGMQKDTIEKGNNALQFDIQDEIQLEEKDSLFRASFNTIYDSLEKEVEIESAEVISFDEPNGTTNFQELCGSDLIVTSEPRIKEEESICEIDKVMLFDNCMQKDITEKGNNAMQSDIQTFETGKDSSIRPSFDTIYDSFEKEVELELPTLKETEISTVTNFTMETATKTDNYISKKPFTASSKPCAPMFTSDLDSQEAIEGERCSFICNFQGYPQPTVSWYNNDISIPRNKEYVITTTETSSMLIFTCVHAHHQGSITCVIFNQYGTDTTFCYLKVKTKENESWDEAETLIKCEVLITKQLTEGDEEELVSLMETNKEKQRFDHDIDRFSLQVPQASYDIPCTLEDPSTFPVEIKITAPTPVPDYEEELKESFQKVESFTEPASIDNIAQKTKHKFKFSFDVSIEAPKLIRGVEKQTKCKEGDCAFLECVISGDPDTLISWNYNNSELKKSDKFNIQETNGTYKLYIKDVSILDSGHYKCVATNKAGTIESESELIVNDAVECYKFQQVEITEDMKPDKKIMKTEITEDDNETNELESSICQNTNIDIEKVDNNQGFQPLSNVIQDDFKKPMPDMAQMKAETNINLFKEAQSSEKSMSKVQHTSGIPAKLKEQETEINNIKYCPNMQGTESTETNKQLPAIPKRRHSFIKTQSTTGNDNKPLEEKGIETVAGERIELPVAPRRRRSVVKSKSETQPEIKAMAEGFIKVTDKGQNLENKNEDTKKEPPTVPKRRRSIVKAKSGIDTEIVQKKDEIDGLVKGSGIGVQPGYGSEPLSTRHLSDFEDADSKFRALDKENISKEKGIPVTEYAEQSISKLLDQGGNDLLDDKLKLNELVKKDVKQEGQDGRSKSDTHTQEIALNVSDNENALGYLEPPPEGIDTEQRDLLTEYLVSAGEHEVLLPQETKSTSEKQKGQITELEVEDVTFSAYYDFYKTQSLIDRSLSPESEMSIAACSSSDEVLDQDHFYTPLPSVEIFQSPLSGSFVTPASSPEQYFTPVEHTFYPNDGDGLKNSEFAVTKSIDISCLPGSSKTEDNIRSHNPGGETNEIGMPPAFIKPLPKRCIYENYTLSFAVEVVGVPLPDIQWYRNSSLLDNSDRIKISTEGHCYIFEINNVQLSEGGEYSCIASNTLGVARTTTLVDILPHDGRSVALPPPVTHQHVMEFDMEPLHTSRSPSPQEILLEVELDESEVKDFEKQVKIITIPEFSPDNKSMVISLDVLPLVYDEQLSSIFTRDNEEVKINFEVPEKPPYFVQPPRDLHVAEKSDAEFKCSVMGLPKPSVTWFREYTKISPDTTKYLIKEDGINQSLLIHSVSMSDVGFYTCNAANHFGDVTCKAMLNVTNLDSITEKEEVAELANISLEGATSIPCNYDLVVDNTAQDANQTEIQLEFEFEGNGNDANKALELVAITNNERDEGGKKCIDVNFDVFAKPSLEKDIQFKSKGSDSCCFEFQITESPPKFEKVLSGLDIQPGATACFNCLVNGSPVPNVSWYRNNILLLGDRYITEEKNPGFHHLEISNVILSDEGQYKCVASNKEGTAETSAFLKVIPIS
ncbi:muscle M-line assembly protein unc-89-like [Xenopus laevis]|uniref:Muscle M-line assembly protein unc-89-like n=1 Tax=Xenopus laevis TaxID=8355 RepID=A0A8J0TXR4_XENLA|nr:muscle M-line assembly protein unc-89-like [Xenopus laevis]